MFSESSLAHQFAANHPSEFAASIADLETDEIQSTLDGLSESVLARVIAEAPRAFADDFISKQEKKRIVRWLTSQTEKHARRLFRRLPVETRNHISAEAEKDDLLKKRLKFGHFNADVAGGIADPNFVRVYHDQTIQDARREIGQQSELNVATVVVLGADETYVGIVEPIELLRSSAMTHVQECTVATPTIPAEMPIGAVAKLKSWQGAKILPVTDRGNHVVGVLNWNEIPTLRSSPSVKTSEASLVPEVLELVPFLLRELLSTTNHPEA